LQQASQAPRAALQAPRAAAPAPGANAAAPSGSSSVLKSVQSSIQSLGERMKDMTLLKASGLTLFIIAVLALIVIVVVYIVIQISKSTFEKTIIVPDTLQLNDPKGLPFIKDSGEIPSAKNGHEFTYSFWIYLGEHYEPSVQHKLVWYRGSSGAENYSFSNPIVYMDGSTNRLYVAILTNQGTGAVPSLSSIADSDSYLVSSIDYVPLQRWVHVAFTLQDGNLTLYMDGDIYSVKNIADLHRDVDTARPIFKGTAGDVTVGSPSSGSMVEGFLSKLEYYNYMVTQTDMMNIYKQGPIKGSILKWLGISQYGLRNPIYKV
jgi:hypothetical protein